MATVRWGVIWMAALALVTLGLAQEPVDFDRWYPLEQAMDIAGHHGRPVMAYFWSATCPYCRHMDTFVLSRPDVAGYLREHYVVALVDMDQPEGQRWAQRYRVVGTPTFVFMGRAPAGWAEAGRVVGSRTAGQFLHELQQMCARTRGGERCA